MKTILVDDELWMLEQFKQECSAMRDIELIGEFKSPMQALDFADSNQVDLAFLDIEMPGMDGLTLMDRLREINSDMVIIIVSAHEQYVGDAILRKKADGFVLKPYSKQDVEEAVLRARLLSKRQKKRVFIHTFGRFNVYVDGEPVVFKSLKAKEILACIVSKYESTVSSGEIFLNIWGDERADTHESKVVFYNAVNRLKKTLEQAGISELLLSLNGEYKINTDICDCDYFRLMDRDEKTIRKFDGSLFTEYSWAEYLVAQAVQDFGIYSDA